MLKKRDSLVKSNERLQMNSNVNQYSETTTDINKINHTVVCYLNRIPIIPKSVVIQFDLNRNYNIGATLVFTCQSDYQTLLNQSTFIACSINGTWYIDTINMTICQLRK